jgi:sulfide dehydrogenase cytochrome subunit
MKIKSIRITLIFSALSCSIYLFSCQKDMGIDIRAESAAANITTEAVVAAIDLPGRTLAANCFQCHGTNGYGLEYLVGKQASEIIGEMNEMKTKNPRADIMNVHAYAYTPAEIRLIAEFFSQQ